MVVRDHLPFLHPQVHYLRNIRRCNESGVGYWDTCVVVVARLKWNRISSHFIFAARKMKSI